MTPYNIDNDLQASGTFWVDRCIGVIPPKFRSGSGLHTLRNTLRTSHDNTQIYH